MEKIINKVNAMTGIDLYNETNALYNEGYRFKVEGDWETLETVDIYGMPYLEWNEHFFTNREEAEKYAETQTWIFNGKTHPKVEEVKGA